MTTSDWQNCLAEELPVVTEILQRSGYTLAADQPHLKGERFLMQAMTTNSGRKLILIGEKDGTPVVIKATKDPAGKDELLHERRCRGALHDIDFAYNNFHSPVELDFITDKKYIISVQKFIEQTSTFLERPLLEQFDFSLQAFMTQEGARATTPKHYRRIARLYGVRTSEEYRRLFSGFITFLTKAKMSSDILKNVELAGAELATKRDRIEQYCGFLTHTDFVPHNFRIQDDTLYLLDFSSLRFGNKHESWARFLNFMTLYHPALEAALIKYVEDNRASEERESLQLMRLFRLGEIISYYVKKSKQSTGQLKELNEARVVFWSDVLKAELTNTRVSRDIVAAYQKKRDQLRSQEEKERQVGLH